MFLSWLLVMGLAAFILSRPRYIVIGRWQSRHDNAQISVVDFYSQITIAIQNRQIADVSFSHVTRMEGHIFNPRRECLRIIYRGDIHDICASPFGTGCYVSWWQFEKRPFIEDLLRKSKQIEKALDTKTEFHIDSSKAFKDTLQLCIHEVIEEITNTRGARTVERKKQK